MEFHGFNKTTLLDFPKHLACTAFTGRCNLRCPFCHNADLVLCPETQPTIPEDSILSVLERRKDTLEGICITGGEPTLQKDLLPFMARCKELGYLVKLDTNGTRPDVIREALERGLLDYIAMDIKNSPARYAETSGLPTVRLSDFEASIALIRESGIPYEFRTTVVKEYHTAEDFLAIGEWLKGSRTYALQSFKDSGNVIAPGLSAYSKDELTAFCEMLHPYFDEVLLRGVE